MRSTCSPGEAETGAEDMKGPEGIAVNNFLIEVSHFIERTRLTDNLQDLSVADGVKVWKLVAHFAPENPASLEGDMGQPHSVTRA